MKKRILKKRETDYKSLFYMGIVFIGAGVVFMTSVSQGLGVVFLGIGGLFMIIGGKNKDKWKNKK